MKTTVVWLTNEQETLTEMSKKSLAPISAPVRHAVKEYLQDKRKRPTVRGGTHRMVREDTSGARV